MGTGTEALTWDIAGFVPQLLVDDATSFLYGPDGLPIEQVDGAGQTNYFFHDQLGSTRVLLGADGKISATFTYDAYGRTTATTGTIRSPLLFTGAFNDGETGLYYLINRYYDPTTAQFLTVDPALDITLTPYGYTGNNPLGSLDPLGLAWYNPFSWSEKTLGTISTVTTVVSACLSQVGAITLEGALHAGEYFTPESIWKPIYDLTGTGISAAYDWLTSRPDGSSHTGC